METLTSRRYRSIAEFQFQDRDGSAIVRTIAYHRKDFCRAVIWFPPREHIHIHTSISSPFQRTSSTDIGILGRLPLELLHDVLLRLDIHSIFRFRQVSSRARQVVDSIHQYQTIVSHGLNGICALLRTQLATYVSLHNYHEALCTEQCAWCGQFAGFISLLLWKRCCFQCLQQAPETQVRTETTVKKQFRLTKSHLNQCKILKSLPGIYSMDESTDKSRFRLMSTYEAKSIRGQTSDTVVDWAISESSTRSQTYNFMASCAVPCHNKKTGKTEHGISCAGCQFAFENDIIGSRCERWACQARDMEYTEEGFLAHFRWCKQAQLLWLSTNGGVRPPVGLP